MHGILERIVNKNLREKRWLVILYDGSHATLGRHSDPSPEEIEVVKQAIDATGAVAWLAVSEGPYYSNEQMKLLLVRRISEAEGSWESAERLWHSRRASALGQQ